VEETISHQSFKERGHENEDRWSLERRYADVAERYRE
jgi:hypothetical protein